MTKIRHWRGLGGGGGGGEEGRGGGKEVGEHMFLNTHTRSFLWPEPHLLTLQWTSSIRL